MKVHWWPTPRNVRPVDTAKYVSQIAGKYEIARIAVVYLLDGRLSVQLHYFWIARRSSTIAGDTSRTSEFCGQSPGVWSQTNLFGPTAPIWPACRIPDALHRQRGLGGHNRPSSQRFECGDDNVFGHQFRCLKISEEQACSHRIQYADKLLS
jgi:hypothetical protein